MPLGYRGIFEVDATTDAIQLATQEFRTWLQGQSWATTHDWEGPGHFLIGPDASLTILEHSAEDGRRLLRLRSTSTNNGLRWTTTLTAVAGSRKSAGGDLIWIDVRSDRLKNTTGNSARMTASVPRLARQILETTVVRDGRAEIAALPRIVRGTDPLEVENLLEVITDDARQIGVVVAGAFPGLSVELWRDTVAKVLRESVGLHAGYVLDEAAFDALNAALPGEHAVPQAGLRTYLPGVDLSDPLDGTRHRVLSPAAIDAGYVRGRVTRRLQWTLGHAVRAHAMERALPRDVRRADQILNRIETDTLLASVESGDRKRSKAATPPAPTPAPRPPAVVPEEKPVREVPLVRPGTAHREPDPAAASEPDYLTALRDLLADAVGTEDVTREALHELRKVVRSASTAERREAKLRDQLENMQLQIYELQYEQERLQRELDDAQQEHRGSEEQLHEAHDQVRWLQKQLTELNAPHIAWSQVPADERMSAPDSFHELVLRLEKEDLQYLRFTGDPEVTLDLMSRDRAGAWAGKAWEALLALDDYARYRAEGNSCEGVHAYLKQTPAGWRSYSANRHAATESRTVQTNTKWQQQRILPVPRDVHPAGKVFMGAHFKIGAGNAVSPRLYYYDDTSSTGLIYVGYLGRHPDNTQS
ncbi:hypothetical protein [Marinactinospora rubrisoli]|uniref:Uncharacterized protein n=1 Tax=Marinactinospora rubrisoli TaxID=2715399 RepID=A0ABW2KJV0_9ACTN